MTSAGPVPSWRERLAEVYADRRVAWVATEATGGLGFHAILPHFALVAADSMGLEDQLDCPVWSPPVGEPSPPRSTAELLADERVVKWLHREGVTDLIVFKPNRRIAARADALGLRLLMADARVAQRFEHKVHFARDAAREGLPIVESAVGDGAPPEPVEISFPLPWVVQGARGHGGVGTAVVQDIAAYRRLAERHGRRSLRVSRFIEGPTLIQNGTVYPDGQVVVGPAYLQLQGWPLCTPFPLGACGNVWQSEVVAPRTSADGAVCKAVGRFLAAGGFVGAFGVDFVAHPDEGPHLIEVNPRPTSGLQLETELALQSSPAPSAAHHLAALAPPPYDLGPEALGGPVPVEARGRPHSQVVFYGTDEEPWAIAPEAQTGIYARRGESLEFLRPGYRSAELNPGELLLLIRGPGSVVEHGGAYARIQFPGLPGKVRSDGAAVPAEELLRAVLRLARAGS